MIRAIAEILMYLLSKQAESDARGYEARLRGLVSEMEDTSKQFKQEVWTKETVERNEKCFLEGAAFEKDEILKIIKSMSVVLKENPDDQPHGARLMIDRDKLIQRVEAQ